MPITPVRTSIPPLIHLGAIAARRIEVAVMMLNINVLTPASISPPTMMAPVAEVATIVAYAISHLIVAPACAAGAFVPVTRALDTASLPLASRVAYAHARVRWHCDRRRIGCPLRASTCSVVVTLLWLLGTRILVVPAPAIGRSQCHPARQAEADHKSGSSHHHWLFHLSSFAFEKFCLRACAPARLTREVRVGSCALQY
jgi:hypothetical protein